MAQVQSSPQAGCRHPSQANDIRNLCDTASWHLLWSLANRDFVTGSGWLQNRCAISDPVLTAQSMHLASSASLFYSLHDLELDCNPYSPGGRLHD